MMKNPTRSENGVNEWSYTIYRLRLRNSTMALARILRELEIDRKDFDQA